VKVAIHTSDRLDLESGLEEFYGNSYFLNPEDGRSLCGPRSAGQLGKAADPANQPLKE